jgi:hypothetical protein
MYCLIIVQLGSSPNLIVPLIILQPIQLYIAAYTQCTYRQAIIVQQGIAILVHAEPFVTGRGIEIPLEVCTRLTVPEQGEPSCILLSLASTRTCARLSYHACDERQQQRPPRIRCSDGPLAPPVDAEQESTSFSVEGHCQMQAYASTQACT